MNETWLTNCWTELRSGRQEGCRGWNEIDNHRPERRCTQVSEPSHGDVRGLITSSALKSVAESTRRSSSDFALHLHTNTIGPIICAQKLINMFPDNPPSKVVFISSDSGSTVLFRSYEDGFGAYAASKAALNQMLRHMAAELARCGGDRGKICVLAMHPGEVQTYDTLLGRDVSSLTVSSDMANIQLNWEVEGSIEPKESVEGMLKVIREKTEEDSGTFWCWDGRVSFA